MRPHRCSPPGGEAVERAGGASLGSPRRTFLPRPNCSGPATRGIDGIELEECTRPPWLTIVAGLPFQPQPPPENAKILQPPRRTAYLTRLYILCPPESAKTPAHPPPPAGPSPASTPRRRNQAGPRRPGSGLLREGRKSTDDDRRALQNPAAVFVLQPNRYTKFSGDRLEGRKDSFREVRGRGRRAGLASNCLLSGGSGARR